MATYITTKGPKYMPDHLRITGLEIKKKDKAERRSNNKFGMEMREIRSLEESGVILVDKNTLSSVKLEKNKKDWKKNNGK